MTLRSLNLSPAASGGIALAAAGLAVMLSLTEASAAARTRATPAAPPPAQLQNYAVLPSRADPVLPEPAPSPTPAVASRPAPSTSQLEADLRALGAQAGATVSISLVQLAPGAGPQFWGVDGGSPVRAGSTYKLPLLMAEAQGVAAGSLKPIDVLCYQPQDWEEGWFDDYVDGSCYTRQLLATRVGQYSDNTAAHLLVRELGGGDALNAYARAHGSVASSFYDPNLTTASDLAALWASEATGRAGGAAAQHWLYPLLTHTQFELGIPAGSGRGAVVAHKIGAIDSVVNDAALVQTGGGAGYVLVVCTDGLGGDAGYSLINAIAGRVAQYETARQLK